MLNDKFRAVFGRWKLTPSVPTLGWTTDLSDDVPYGVRALGSPLALPDTIAVGPVPMRPTREACCPDHPDARHHASEYHVPGLGSLLLTGCVAPGRALVSDGPGYSVPDPGLMADVCRLAVRGPGPLAAADPAVRVAWLTRRLVALVSAVVVQWAQSAAHYAPGSDPLLDAELARWTRADGRVISCPASRLVLTDPTTY